MAKLENRRWAAFAGLAVASATTLVVTMAGPAMADDHSNSGDSKEQATSCTEQVRVRSQPSMTAPVIGSCKAGEKVTVDKTENGFAYLVNKSGWASVDYLGLGGDKSDNNSDDNSDSDSRDGDNNDNSDDNSDDNNRDNNNDGGGLGL